MSGASRPIDGAGIAAASMDGGGVIEESQYGFANERLAGIHGVDAAEALVEWNDRPTERIRYGDGELADASLRDHRRDRRRRPRFHGPPRARRSSRSGPSRPSAGDSPLAPTLHS